MQPTFLINHGGGPCFFLDPGPMRDAWSELEPYLGGFTTVAGSAETTAEAFDLRRQEAVANSMSRDQALVEWEQASAPARRSRARITCCR